MIEYQLEAMALWPRRPKKQLRKGTQDGKGFCRRESREGLEQGNSPKCKIARDLWRTLEARASKFQLSARTGWTWYIVTDLDEAHRCLATKVPV